MGFKFGLIQSLDPILSLKTFVAVVAFIILFEYITEVLEYLLEESYAYSKMLQIIYKELMLMGVISFGIIMYEAANESPSSSMYDTIVAIDFVHIILFYLTIFFVVHAFYLIRISIINYRKYRHYFAVPLADLAERVGILSENPCSIGNLLFRSDFVLLSSLRDKVEFKMVQSVFHALYLVPKNFNYPAYIAGCYERYALKTINRTFLSWVMFLLVIIVNFLRLYIGYNCTIHQNSSAHRYLLEEDLLGGGTSYGGGSHYGSGTGTGSSSHHSAESTAAEDENCRKLTVREFLAAGGMVVLYNVILLIVSRIYKLRLVHMAGTEGSHDFSDFLAHIHQHEQFEKATNKAVHRFTTKRFLDDINKEMATDEHGNDEEDEEEFVHRIGKAVKGFTRWMRDWMASVRLAVRVCLVSCFCPERKAKIDRARSTKSVFGGGAAARRKSSEGAAGAELSPTTGDAHSPAWHASVASSLALRKKGGHQKKSNIRDRIRVDFHRPLPLTRSKSLHLDDTDLCNIVNPVDHAHEGKSENGPSAGDALLRHKSRMLEAVVQSQIEESRQAAIAEKKKSKLHMSHYGGAPAAIADPAASGEDTVGKGIELLKKNQRQAAGDADADATRGGVTRLRSEASMNPSRVRLPEEAVGGGLKSTGSFAADSPSSRQRRQVVAFGADDSPASSLSNSADEDDRAAPPPKAGALAQRGSAVLNVRAAGSRANVQQSASHYDRVGARAVDDVELGLRLEHADGYGAGDEDEEAQYGVEDVDGDELLGREVYLLCPVRSYRAQVKGYNPDKDALREELAQSGYKAPGAADHGAAQAFFNRIYFFHSPEAYARAIEFGIMANCLFMAIWVTNMITISKDVHHDEDYEVLAQIGMVVPILTTFYILPFITETASLLVALSDLNLGVVKKVLEGTVETAELVREVRREVMECSGEMEELNPERLDNLHREYQTVLSEMQLLNAQILKYQSQLAALGPSVAQQKARRSSVSQVDGATLAATIADLETLRASKIKTMTDLKFQIDNFASEGRKEFIADLFAELDSDGSGYIDRDEFRALLRKLELTYNNHKFKLLFRAIDGDDGNGKISEDELKKFLFPTTHSLIEDIDHAMVTLEQHQTNRNDAVHRYHNSHF